MNSNLINPLAAGIWLSTWLLALTVYLSLRSKLRHLQRDEQLGMSRARQKAVKVVSNARDQAVDIISSAKISADEDKFKLQQKLEEISASQLREFEKLITNVSKDIESDAIKEIDEFKQALEMETVQSQKVVADRIQQKYTQIEAEIAEYKKQKLTQLDGQISQLVGQVIKELTGQIIPMEEHQKLVMQALLEAKKKL